MNKPNRKLILQSLISFRDSIDSLRSQLSKFPWDCDEPVISMSIEDLKSVLRRCLEGQITIEDLEKWADLIELREDIEFIEGDSNNIKFIIYILANPDINGRVDHSMLQQWLKN